MYNGNIFPLANHWLAIYKGILSRHPGPSMMENVTEHAGLSMVNFSSGDNTTIMELTRDVSFPNHRPGDALCPT
jgi:hypothetical protein